MIGLDYVDEQSYINPEVTIKKSKKQHLKQITEPLTINDRGRRINFYYIPQHFLHDVFDFAGQFTLCLTKVSRMFYE